MSDQMDKSLDEKLLKSLKSVETPAPSQFAKQKALGLAMEEFDAVFDENLEKNEKTSNSTQGFAELERPMSITNWIKGFIPMNARFPIVATMSGLLLLPLGLFLFQNTSLTPIGGSISNLPIELGADAGELGIDDGTLDTESADSRDEKDFITTAEEGATAEEGRADIVDGDVIAVDQVRVDGVPPAEPLVLQGLAASAPPSTVVVERERVAGEAVSKMSEAPLVRTAPMGGIVEPSPTDGFFTQEQNNDKFAEFVENTVKSVWMEPVSTFSIDVDTASYAYVRRTLFDGRMPTPNAVRIEEMVNYFSYNYDAPRSIETPFAPQIEITPTPWNEATQLMRIGIEGYVPPASERKPVNLVFLIDTSGSMNSPDKLPLLKQAFALVVDQLNENDRVSIVTYAGSAGTVLEPTAATNKAAILNALENLQAGGSTAGAAGIEQAYRLAEQSGVEGSVNRVLLATDGDFNVGISSEEELKRFIETKRESGTFLSILGFGTGNLNDALMQTLAQNGNGSAYYIDSFREAHKVLVDEIGSTLTTIAKDVKIQIEFNPALIAEYRLIGYETRALNREDFNNDQVDAGDIGAGHTVTALYELTPVGAASQMIEPLRYGETVTLEGGEVAVSSASLSEFGFFKLRYKAPDGDVSKLIELPITLDMVQSDLSEAHDDTRFAIAVAAFGQKLRGSNYGGDMTYAEIRALAAGSRGEDAQGYRAEFLSLVDLAAAVSGEK